MGAIWPFMSRFEVQQENIAIVEEKKRQFSIGHVVTFVGVLGRMGKEYWKRYEITLSEAISWKAKKCILLQCIGRRD